MKLQHKAWLMVASTISVLTLASVFGSQHSISAAFDDLEHEQFRVEGERANRLLNQQLEGLAATSMDYAYWSDTAEYIAGSRPEYFTDNFGTDNMKYLGISSVLILDAVGQVVASAELTPEPALRPVSDSMSQMLRSLAVPVLSDASSKTLLRTYRRMNGELLLISIAAVRSQFKPGSAPTGALAVVRRFDAKELERFSNILMRPVRLTSESSPFGAASAQVTPDQTKAESSAPVLDHEGRPVASIVLGWDRVLHQTGRSLALVGAMQVAFASFVVGSLLVFLLNQLVLRRLQTTHEELSDVTREGIDGSGLLSVEGSDELTDLAKRINVLLSTTRNDAAQQRAAHKRQEALHLQLMQSQKTEALGRFTSGIAHDFNNSLAAISGWVRLANEDLTADHASVSSLDQALKSIRHASGLMKQLLSFSRQSAPRTERLRLSAMIEEARTLVSFGLMGRCTLQVDCRTSDDWIQADPTQIKQVLVNLLINAHDAMNGKGVITLVLESYDLIQNSGDSDDPLFHQLPNGRYVTLSVQDEGPGIAPEHIDRVFEPFFTTKEADKGTGLGLSVVQGIMARHCGAVRVINRPGAGACFLLILPAQVEASVPLPFNDSSHLGITKRLLYAEDDSMVREAWSTLLERHGWKVTRAQDGEQAWELYQDLQGRWDAVLTDLSMPKMTGLQLALSIGASTSPPPMILMSGQISADIERQLKEVGFSAVLHKPVDKDELLRVLNEATIASC